MPGSEWLDRKLSDLQREAAAGEEAQRALARKQQFEQDQLNRIAQEKAAEAVRQQQERMRLDREDYLGREKLLEEL